MTGSVSSARQISDRDRTCAIERRDLVLELLKDALHHANRVQLIAMDSSRKRQLLSRLQTFLGSPRDHDGDVNWMAAIELTGSEVVLRDGLRRHVREIKTLDDRNAIHNIASEVDSRSTSGEYRRGRNGREKLHYHAFRWLGHSIAMARATYPYSIAPVK